VDCRKTQHIAELNLGNGKREVSVAALADIAQPSVDLAEQMGNPLQRVATSLAEQPLSGDGAINDSHPPQGLADLRS
jgi:hypothetical protein